MRWSLTASSLVGVYGIWMEGAWNLEGGWVDRHSRWPYGWAAPAVIAPGGRDPPLVARDEGGTTEGEANRDNFESFAGGR